jgi:hypothetical protein
VHSFVGENNVCRPICALHVKVGEMDPWPGVQLLCAKIIKAQKDSQVIYAFFTFGICMKKAAGNIRKRENYS